MPTIKTRLSSGWQQNKNKIEMKMPNGDVTIARHSLTVNKMAWLIYWDGWENAILERNLCRIDKLLIIPTKIDGARPLVRLSCHVSQSQRRFNRLECDNFYISFNTCKHDIVVITFWKQNSLHLLLGSAFCFHSFTINHSFFYSWL